MAQVVWNLDIDVYNPSVIPVSVARCIAKYLQVKDLLSFAKVSKNTHRAVNEPRIWISRLRDMDLWNKDSVKLTTEELKKIDFSWLNSPLSCLDNCIRSPRAAKYQVIRIDQCLLTYYNDFLINKPFNRLKIFKVYHSPEQQAKILSNLLRYNRSDPWDESRIILRDKINALIEIFENALLRELEIHYDIHDFERARKFVEIMVYLKNQQTLIDFFLQKTVFDNETTELFDLESLNTEKLFIREARKYDLEGGITENSDDINNSEYSSWVINTKEMEQLIGELASLFNHQSEVIDLVFPQTVPMMYKLCEELISNQIAELIMLLTDASKEKGLYLDMVLSIYYYFTADFIKQLKESKNLGDSYHRLIRELIDMMFESFAAEYIRDEVLVFKAFSTENIDDWNLQLSKREKETSLNILKHVKTETKNDFLTTFKKVFTIAPSSSSNEEKEEGEKYSEIQAKTKILAENLKSLNQILSPELVLNIINEAKVCVNRLLKLRSFSIASFRGDLLTAVQDIFITVIDTIGNDHLKVGFNKALDYLQNYNPNDEKNKQTDNYVEPLVVFFELINIADLIIQMIDIFYKEELEHRQIVKHQNSVLNPSLQSKKKMEGLVDKYVADGLNIGIEVLVNEIENVFANNVYENDYNPQKDSSPLMGTTEAAKKAVKILDDNMDLLVDSTDKSIVEVFQQEIAERFLQIVVKDLKKRTISVSGATTLICDLNLYHDFMVNKIKTNKRLIIPYYQALKKVGSIYLISGSDSKAIGKLVSDLSKFNGIFGQEEIYEFVQRREDWLTIRRDVEKVMYGFGLADCTIV